MTYSNIRTEHFLIVLLLAASLACTRYAMATESFSPLELERLRQVSRALLETRATDRQRVLRDCADQRQVLADVDTRLRALEAAVWDEHLPRTQGPRNSSTGALASQLRSKAAETDAAIGKSALRAPSSAPNSARRASDAASNAQPAAGNSNATLVLIDDVRATVSVHKRALSKAENDREPGAMAQLARLRNSSATPAIGPAIIAQARVTEALNIVEAELGRMRVHGADLQGLRRAREKLTLTVPPPSRDIAPTFQTITRHYR